MNGPALTSEYDFSVEQHWRRLNGSRLDWAHRAHRSFLASLDERTRSCFADHDGEASVVLFGRTQVGKTTLLLRLLNIAPEQMAHVSTLLRGGRASGHSATSTAMQYQRSLDQNWRITIDGVEHELTDGALVDELARIRNAVESGSFNARDPITVSIPSQLFDVGANAQANVRILDLPGDNPRDAAEAEHVRRIAERYVPHADLILIVGKADDLSFLNPRAFQLPGIRDWRFTPTRFRVITTYSFSLQSLIDWATRQSMLDADHFRAHMMEQLATHEITLSIDAQNPRLYFPLEFGDSWDNMRRDDPALYEKTNPVVVQLMDELRSDIAAAAQPHGRIRQAAFAHVVAARIKEETLACMAEHVEALEKSSAKATATVNDVLKLRDVAIRSLAAKVESTYTEPNAGALRRRVTSAVTFDTHSVDELGTNTTHFVNLIHKCCATLTTAALAFSPPLPPPLASLRQPCDAERLRRVANECFDALRARISGYFIDEYYPKLSSDFKNDKAALRQAIEEAVSAVANHVAAKWIEAIRAKVAAIGLERVQLTRTVADREQAYRHAQSQQQYQQQELDRARETIDRFSSDMDADIERGRQFTSHVLDAFEAELAERKRAIRNAKTPSERWLELLAAVGICDEKDKLLSGQ